MKHSMQKGNSTIVDVLILVGLVVFIFFVILPGDSVTLKQFADSKERGSRSNSSSSRDENERSVSLGRGSAANSYRPYEEYITIRNTSDTAIDITGWKLANAKDKRVYEVSGQRVTYPREEAAIPQAAAYLGSSRMQNVVLLPGETAVVTSGTLGATGSPYGGASFKENVCSGYLAEETSYYFDPSISLSCPTPEDEPGVSSLPRECRDVVESLSECEIPTFGKNRDGSSCPNCVNGERVSGSCADFVRERFNYISCIATHSGDSDFHLRTWRIYLNRSSELWAEEDESILLYDRSGNLVDSISY